MLRGAAWCCVMLCGAVVLRVELRDAAWCVYIRSSCIIILTRSLLFKSVFSLPKGKATKLYSPKKAIVYCMDSFPLMYPPLLIHFMLNNHPPQVTPLHAQISPSPTSPYPASYSMISYAWCVFSLFLSLLSLTQHRLPHSMRKDYSSHHLLFYLCFDATFYISHFPQLTHLTLSDSCATVLDNLPPTLTHFAPASSEQAAFLPYSPVIFSRQRPQSSFALSHQD